MGLYATLSPINGPWTCQAGNRGYTQKAFWQAVLKHGACNRQHVLELGPCHSQERATLVPGASMRETSLEPLTTPGLPVQVPQRERI